MADPSLPTREVFAGIAPWMQALFYTLAAVSLAAAAGQVARRARLWRAGTAGEIERDPRVWMRRFRTEILGQRRAARRPPGGPIHLLLFWGFVVLAVGTTLLFLADAGPVNFHRGAYFLAYELAMDLFGVLLAAGCALALGRRVFGRPASMGHRPADAGLLLLILAITATGYLLEALRLCWDGTPPETARWSFVGASLARALGGAAPEAARAAHLWTWWLHALLVLAFLALFPRTRLLHALTGSLSILLRPSRPAGALPSVSLETVEATGRVGAASAGDFSRLQLLSLDACMECGRCEQACPAFASGKPLSPRAVVMDLRQAMARGEDTPAPLLRDETLWACTMCQACVTECPVRIGHVDMLAELRRNRVGEGRLTGPPAQALRRLAGQGNPFGEPETARLEWAAGLEVPTVEQNPGFEVLLWVGCAATFDPRARRAARATALLLRRAGVNFAVLGRGERCSGDPARRLGEEFLFQQLAGENAARLGRALGDEGAGARRIVTPCPHCMNTLRHEYPAFGGSFTVLHHTQLLAELAAAGRLPAADGGASPAVTLHDPCYLARVNGETDAARRLVAAAGCELREMPRHGERTFCCGAGGGRAWFEERPEQRVNRLRAEEAAATGAETLVTACPFCLNMMADGAAGTPGAAGMRVLDAAELLLARAGGEDAPDPA